MITVEVITGELRRYEDPKNGKGVGLQWPQLVKSQELLLGEQLHEVRSHTQFFQVYVS